LIVPTLIILGNKNQYTFANSIVAANWKAQQLFRKPLGTIFVLHSAGSHDALRMERGWVAHLAEHNIRESLLIPRVMEVSAGAGSIEQFAEYIELILQGVGGADHVMVDLTNGATLQKNLLAIVAYILDIRHQFLIDTITLSELTKFTKELKFLSLDVLQKSYQEAPDSSHLDDLAYINLAEIVRYRHRIATETARYAEIEPALADPVFFRDNFLHSVKFKLMADREKDSALYRIAAASVGTSIDDMLELIIRKLNGGRRQLQSSGLTLGAKLARIREAMNARVGDEFDHEFLRTFNEFVRYLRNSTTHKGRLLTDSEAFKAELSILLSLPFVRYYTEIVYPHLTGEQEPTAPRIRRLALPAGPSAVALYFGLDGDDTGRVFEDLFLVDGEEQRLRDCSEAVSNAISRISERIKNIAGKHAIIFSAGDDILFKGKFTQDQLRDLHDLYPTTTNGLTCSIGYGRSLREAFLALKLAKTTPGKNSIIGIELLGDEIG